MSPRLLACAGLALSLAAATVRADAPCTQCAPAKQPNYTLCRGCLKKDRPPYVHPGTPYGYYPTEWSAWPCTKPKMVFAPHNPMADAERLPPPRPDEGK